MATSMKKAASQNIYPFLVHTITIITPSTRPTLKEAPLMTHRIIGHLQETPMHISILVLPGLVGQSHVSINNMSKPRGFVPANGAFPPCCDDGYKGIYCTCVYVVKTLLILLVCNHHTQIHNIHKYIPYNQVLCCNTMQGDGVA